MVQWSAVYRPKDYGGLGILNTKIFNDCLMTKWIWKIYNQPDGLWVRILKAKYMRHGDFFRSSGLQGSQFWKSIHKIKYLFKWGVIHKVGNGCLTQFWNDVWLQSSPLRICFPILFDICDNTRCVSKNLFLKDPLTLSTWAFLLCRSDQS
jgi:hypothetical protein